VQQQAQVLAFAVGCLPDGKKVFIFQINPENEIRKIIQS
jgi:hypothetical protein